MIFQKHDKHGRHIAYSPQEAEANRKKGWKDVTKEEFFAKALPSQSVPRIETRPIETPSQEAPKEVVPAPKKRGRPRVSQWPQH
jgi:hypothetical protein